MIEGIGHLPRNPELKGQAELLEHIRYSENGQELSLLLPWAPMDDRSGKEPTPLLLFVQGSAWTTPNLGYEIPMLSHFAEEGYVVASICHRDREKGYPFPAFLEDAKCAIRFLRAHAKTYAIDPERVCAFGTSSGGNTVCLLGVTGDEESYRNGEYDQESDAVSSVIACFAPTELVTMFEGYELDQAALDFQSTLFGSVDPKVVLEGEKAMSPALLLREGVKKEKYPTFLLLHGTGDSVVPYSQMEIFYEELKKAGAEVKAYYVDGAQHEGDFWSPAVRRVIHEEVVSRLGKAPGMEG